MKYYETHYEEYIHSVKSGNIHPELEPIFAKFPKSIEKIGNMIIYGPTGSGKYSQLLYFLERYSPSHLKYDKKISIHTDKQSYTYRISDIHYEIDMALLGCHSKALWHEIFFQIVDIISMKTDKVGIIVCRNFHMIHSELLEVFYSYIQHCNTINHNVHIRFILLTEHISFIPNNILNCSEKLSIGKPSTEQYAKIHISEVPSSRQITDLPSAVFSQKIATLKSPSKLVAERGKMIRKILDDAGASAILNLKELHSFSMVENSSELPKDIFNIICDNIIREMSNPKTLEFTEFRECLYDILIYNLDITDCLWYILHHFIQLGAIRNTAEILSQIYVFLKYYNNNYRPIYHLESIFFYLLLQLDT